MIDVYLLYAIDIPKKYLHLLSDYRKQKIQSITDSFLKQQQFIIESLLIEAIKLRGNEAMLPLHIDVDLKTKKPYLLHDSFYFNISYSNHYYMVAIAEHPIGCDIQFSKSPQKLINRFKAISNLKFNDLWVIYEAVVKLDGRGTIIPIESLQIKDDYVILENKHIYYQLNYFKDLPYAVASYHPISINRVIVSDAWL